MISRLRKLRDERAELIKEARVALSAAFPQDGSTGSAESFADYKLLEAKLDANSKDLVAETRKRDAEVALPPVFDPQAAAFMRTLPPEWQRTYSHKGAWPQDDLRRTHGRSYRELFGEATDAGGFENFREMAGLVFRGQFDPRLSAVAGSGSETVGVEGGFMVPTEYASQMLDRALEDEIVRPRADVVPMTTVDKQIADFDRSDTSSGAPMGFAAQWLAEGATATVSVPKVRPITLRATKLSLYCNCTNELIADATQFERLLGENMPAAVGWALDNSFFTGTGAGQPVGVLNDPALVTVTKETSQPAGTILYPNLAKMYGSLHPSLIGEAVWVVSPTAVPQLLQLTAVIKNVAGAENVGGSWIPVQSVGGQLRILNLPVLITEKVPNVGTKGDILLCAFSQYIIGLRKDISIDSSIHVGWLQDERAFRVILRCTGQGKWPAPFKNKQGTSLSWCVALENR